MKGRLITPRAAAALIDTYNPPEKPGSNPEFENRLKALTRTIAEKAIELANAHVPEGSADICVRLDGSSLIGDDGRVVERACISPDELQLALRIEDVVLQRLHRDPTLFAKLFGDRARLDAEAAVALQEIERSDQAIVDDFRAIAGSTEGWDFDGDRRVSPAEAAACALTDPNWERFRPVLEKYGLRHPLDTQRFSQELQQHLRDLAYRVERRTGTTRDDPLFCRTFLPLFVDEGRKSYEQGGICLTDTRPSRMTGWARVQSVIKQPELTAEESLNACMYTTGPYGSCTENTYKVISALRAAGIDCPVESMLTEGHAYPGLAFSSQPLLAGKTSASFDPLASFWEQQIDPSRLATIGWSAAVDPAAMYVDSLGGIARRTDAPFFFEEISSLVEPRSFFNRGAIVQNTKLLARSFEPGGSDAVSDADRTALIQGTLDLFDGVITATPANYSSFMRLAIALKDLPPKGQQEVGLAILERWGSNPYAILPLWYSIFSGPAYQKASAGDAAAVKETDAAVQLITHDLETRFPSSGRAETLLALHASARNRLGDARRIAEKGLLLSPSNAVLHQLLAFDDARGVRLDASEGHLRRAIAVAPNLPNNHFLLGQIASWRGDDEAALRELSREYGTSYTGASHHLLRMQLYNKTGRIYATMAEANSMLRSPQPTGVLASLRLLQTDALIQAGRSADARKLLDEVEQRFAAFIPPYYLYSYHLVLQDEPKARELIRQIPADQPALRAMAQVDLALYHHDVPAVQERLAEFKAVPGMDRKVVERYELAAWSLTGDRRAIESYLERHPADRTAQQAMADLLLQEGELEKARPIVAGLMERAKDVVDVQLLKVEMLLEQGRNQEAVHAVTPLFRSDPDNYGVRVMTARAYAAKGHGDAALNLGRKLAAQFPKNPAGKITMARALAAQGRKPAALAMLAEARPLATPGEIRQIERLERTIGSTPASPR